ncbi:MAG: signal peptidase II [Candidatus Aminicenantes bacterium]|nr:signal peptidase II [Candidatus Aminicenantes bacterium]
MKRHRPYLVLIAVLIAADQITKAVVAKTVPFYGSVSVIPGFFAVSHIHNTGAIFGLFNGSSNKLIAILLTAATLTAMGMVTVYFFKTPTSQKAMRFALALILAGALGNFVDRLFRGHVIDFLEVHVKKFYWPTFNIADSCISIGAVLLVFILVTRRS